MLLLEILFGSLLGFILGLVPNLHINTIGFLFLLVGLYNLFPQNLFLFISICISQFVASFVSNCLFGIPNTQTILNIFPTHKLFIEGKAKTAVFLSLVGCFLGLFFSLSLLPLLYILFNVLGFFDFFIYTVILFVLFLFIIEEKTIKQKLVVLSIIIFSGCLGVLTIKTSYFLKQPLLVCIFGLFAAPFLLLSCFKSQEKTFQKKQVNPISLNLFVSFLGSFVSMFIILIPSFSSAQAGIIISKIYKKISSNQYIVLFSTIAFSSIIFSFFLAFTFFKSRLGYIVVLRSVDIISTKIDWVLFCLVVIISCCVSILLVLFFIDDILLIINKTKTKLINQIVFLLSTLIIVLISGVNSLFFLLTSISIGFLPIVFNKRRVILMSFIMIPTLLYYIW
jgi:putative membrane protein